MKKAIIFLRVSTQKQTLEQQQEVMLQQALKDYKESEIIIIKGKESASKLDADERKTLEELNRAIATYKTIERVYLFAVDRLARKTTIVIDTVKDLASKGIDCYFHFPYQMHSLGVDGKLSPMTDMMLYFLGVGAEQEILLKNERVAAKREYMKQNGQVYCGKVRFGYMKNETTKEIEINESEAEWVRFMFTQYATNNESLSTLADEMIRKGIFKDAKYSTKIERIRDLLTNPLYSGRMGHRNNGMKYPPIVTPELQDKVIAMLKANRKGEKKDTSTVYLAKGLLRDKTTNHLMILNRRGANFNTNADAPKRMSISINAIEHIIWVNTLHHFGILKAHERHNNKKQYMAKVEENNAIIERLNGYIEDLEKDFKRMYQVYKKGLVPIEEYEADVKENRKKQTAYKSDIAKLQTENKQMEEVINSSKFNGTLEVRSSDDLDSMPDENKKDLVKRIFKNVYLTKDAKDNHYYIEFETVDFIHNMGMVFEYWVRGGVPHLLQHREGMPTFDITKGIKKKIERIKK